MWSLTRVNQERERERERDPRFLNNLHPVCARDGFVKSCEQPCRQQEICAYEQCGFSQILGWPVRLAQVLPRPQLIFPCKTWFFGFYLNFQQLKSLKNQYLPHSDSKSYQNKFHKIVLSRSFQQQQRHIPIPLKFSATI